jgi:hypothetical protein
MDGCGSAFMDQHATDESLQREHPMRDDAMIPDTQQALANQSKVLSDEEKAEQRNELEHVQRPMVDSAAKFITFLRDISPKQELPEKQASRLPFFLAFDEAHGLVDNPDFPASRSVYHNLETVLSWLRDKDIFSLFISTSSKLSGFAPPASLHPSARAVSSGKLIAPFTELPFDIAARGLVNKLQESGPLTLIAATQFSTIVKFGRPLWVRVFVNSILF